MTSLKPEATVFDYGVSTADCKSAILQISVQDGYLYVYERGTVKRSHSLLLLVKFTSDKLRVKFDFLDGPLEVALESTEVKADLFHLLSLVFDSQSDGRPERLQHKPSSWDLQLQHIAGNKVIWVRERVTVHRGYITCWRNTANTPDLVIELWSDSYINRGENSLTLTNAGHSFSFKGLPSTKCEDFANCLESAKRHPKKLTEEDIKAVVLGSTDEEEDIEEEKATYESSFVRDKDADSNVVAEDEVDGTNEDELDGAKDDVKDPYQDVVDADAEAQSFLFLSSFPWRRSKKPPRKPTEDEEFVMIELEEVLKIRAEVTAANDETAKPKHVQKDTPGTQSIESQQNTSGTDGEKIINRESPEKSRSLLTSSTSTQSSSTAPPPPLPPPPPPPAPPGGGPAPPPPPPPPGALPTQPVGLKLKSLPTAKLKPVHWTKVPQARIDKSLWSKVDDKSENLDLKSLEGLFFLKENTKFSNPNRDSTSSTGSSCSKGLLLNFERARTLGIVFKRPYERVLERLKDALCSIHELDVFKVEKLQQMKKLVPTPDDRETYRPQTREKLVPADRFMYDLCGIQELGVRLDLTLAVLTLPADIKDSTQKVSDLKMACKEVVSSPSFREVVGYFRDVGNYLNAGRTGGVGVYGFQVTSVDKLLEIKNSDTGVTVFDWIIQQLKVKDSQLLSWASSLKHVHACCEIDMKAVEAYINNLKSTIKLQRESLEQIQQLTWNSHEKKYFKDAKSFLAQQEVEVSSLRERFSGATSSYKNMLEYLCEPSDRKSGEVFSSLSDLMRKFEIALATK